MAKPVPTLAESSQLSQNLFVINPLKLGYLSTAALVVSVSAADNATTEKSDNNSVAKKNFFIAFIVLAIAY